jgi:hypothetical protein
VTHALRRRLDRLTDRIAAGRMIVLGIAYERAELGIAYERAEDAALVDATLADAGIVRDDSDLLVLVTRYATPEGEPPCALLSVSPLAQAARRAPR